MKAIILAAGLGTRLGKYTKNRPKGMLFFSGKPLIQWQINAMKKAGVKNIIIVTGYKREYIDFSDVHYYHNRNYASTNMVESLMCARDDLDDDILVSYSDIIFETGIVKKMLNSPHDIAVAVDEKWRSYWRFRYGDTEKDLETLKVSSNGRIVELGEPVENSAGIDYRYMGLLKFSRKGIRNALEIYHEKKRKGENWSQSGSPFLQGYMTDLLNELITSGYDVWSVICQNGWLEFDTESDFKGAEQACRDSSLSEFITFP